MYFFSKKKNPHETCCLACHGVVAGLLFLASLVALLGVFMAHYNPQEQMLVLGSMAGSLSLLAFSICLSLCMYALKCCLTKCDACGVVSKK